MEPEQQKNNEILDELRQLRQEVKEIRSKDNSYLMGIIQGVLLAIAVWYILTPLAHWSVSSMISFVISTPLIEKIKYWLSFPFFFIPTIGIFSYLFKTEDKGTNRSYSRIWSFGISAVILIVYSMGEAWPVIKSMM